MAEETVRQWLHEHQLSDAQPIFTERQISIEELVEFDINDLRTFADEIGLDTLQKNRFIKGIKKMQSNHPNDNNNSSVIHRNYYDESTKFIQELQASFKNVDETVERCKNEVHKTFSELFEKLKIQQAKILKDIDENGKNKKNEIEKQLQTIIDARIEMKQLQYNDIEGLKAMVSAAKNYKLSYEHNKTAENNLLTSMHLKASALPPTCVIIIDDSNITSHSVKISWAVSSNSSVTQYEIQYAKLKHIGRKNKKSKRIKKKKYRKNKNKKQTYESSSSSSDATGSSSSASSSATDSGSDTESNSTDSGDGDIDDEKQEAQIQMTHIDVAQLKFKLVVFENTEKMVKKNSYKIKDLQGGCCYVVRMRSKNALGCSEWSDCVKVITSNKNKWQFQENGWIWKDFDRPTAKKIQHAYANHKKKCFFSVASIGQSYCINFKSMEQRNVNTRKIRKVRIVHR